MQKIKNLLHHNQDANHNGIPDSQERDRNHNGIPDSQERRHNPLDRNHDGKVSLSDLKPGAKTNTIVAPGSTATTTTTTTGAGLLSNDRNMNGIPDNLERGSLLSNDRNMNGIPDNLERRGGLSNDRNMNGIPDNLERGSLLSNDRNMNGIPDNLEGGLATTRLAPTHVEVIEKGVVVHEHIHPVEKEEIQPVIYREREQLDVKQITQQLHETQIQPTLVQQRELAAEVRAPIVERGAPIQENVVLPSVDRDATMRSQVVHAPIVNETIKKTVIEEIQPVLERDIIQSTLIQETKPIYEKIIEAPHVYRETVVVQDRGINGGSLQALSAQGFNLGTFSSNDRNMNGIPDNLERRSGFSNDRNMNGIPDNLERGSGFSNDRNMNGIPDNLERGGLSNDRNMNGIPDNLERRHNPLDRNGDGRVDLKDLTGRPGYGQQGLAGGLSNDRNMNGIPDNLERGNLSNDRNMNGVPDNMERRNPLDRNGDGRVDLKDLSGQPGYGQQGLMGQRTANPLDRNNDGKVDLKDLAPNKAAAPLGSQAPLRTL